MAIIDAEGGVDGVANVGVWGDGIAASCELRGMGVMIVLGPAVDWFPLALLVASFLSLCSLAWLTLLTTPAVSESMISLAALIKSSLSLRSASSALEPDSEELASSMGERGAWSLFSSVAGSTGAS